MEVTLTETQAISKNTLVSEPVIDIKNVNHYFGKGSLKKQVLFDVSLEIYPGEIVLMTGPSGFAIAYRRQSKNLGQRIGGSG